MGRENNGIKLLWTGGWDSTYRLLSLLIEQKRTVQPYYLIDAERRSTTVELQARNKIKENLFERCPETRDMLLPTIFFDRVDLPAMPQVTAAYRRVAQNKKIGTQYEWMARYCVLQDLHGIETCFHATSVLGRTLYPLTNHIQTENDSYFAMDPRYQGTDEYLLFGHYHLPVYDIPKKEMERRAQAYGWLDLLSLSWFCHRPIAEHIPCGRCGPCKSVMKAGLSWRLPWMSKILFYGTLRPYINTPVYQSARQLKQKVLQGRS